MLYIRKSMTLSLLCVTVLFSFAANSQRYIKGRVIDKLTREPLELALVTDIKTTQSILTDKQGLFSWKLNGDTASLIVSFIGYESARLVVADSPQSPLTIELQKGVVEMKEVTVLSNTSLNTFHTISRIDLNMQPARSAQDLLRLVPGLFIAQHQGGGKAEQIFLRGFDADHGTDVNISVDGIPVNMVSHAHGQGYADLHFLIPETVADYDFGKGPYYANRGDFTTAGYVAYNTLNVAEKSLVKLEGGQFGLARAVALINLFDDKARDRGQSAYIAGEGLYFNGPFDYPEHFQRYNLFGKLITPISAASKLTLELSALSSGWRAAGEIPNRAVAEGYIKDRFGVIDSAQGGYTSRTNASIKLVSSLKNNVTLENQVYYSYYFFNLISNFTFYYYYPETGDQFRQHESRNLTGYNGRISKRHFFGDGELVSSAGMGVRYDAINPAWLAHSRNEGEVLSYIQSGIIHELNMNAYVDESYRSGKWLLNGGLRWDLFHFYYLNQAPASDTAAALYDGLNPRAVKAILSPKINIQYTVNPNVQVYLKAGKSFHSNDARIVIANEGYQILPAAYGADLGVNWKPLPKLFVNTAIWWLYLQQEFTYGADLGDQAVSPGGRTRRTGLDLSLRYQFTSWLYAHLDMDFAQPRSLDDPKGANYIALAPGFTSTGALIVKMPNGINGSISYRYMHNRPANTGYSLIAMGYWVTDLSLNYTRKKYEVGLLIENLFNVEWNEGQFEYTSRLKNETVPVDGVSYTPGTPFFAKLKFSIFF